MTNYLVEIHVVLSLTREAFAEFNEFSVLCILTPDINIFWFLVRSTTIYLNSMIIIFYVILYVIDAYQTFL